MPETNVTLFVSLTQKNSEKCTPIFTYETVQVGGGVFIPLFFVFAFLVLLACHCLSVVVFSKIIPRAVEYEVISNTEL